MNNLQAQFDNLSEITGLPFINKGKRKVASVYINGSVHRKKDKTYAILKPNGIYIKENGGEDLSLKEWLEIYGDVSKIKGKYKEKETEIVEQKKQYFVDDFLIDATIPLYYTNYLFTYLCQYFDKLEVKRVFKMYNVGEVGKSEIVFWYKNISKQFVHDTRLIYLDNGKRNKDYGGYRQCTIEKGYTGNCLFGSHLLNDCNKNVGVVESEKTAIIMALYDNSKIWVATGGATKMKQIELLINDYELYPDYDEAGSKWECFMCDVPYSERRNNGYCLLDMKGHKSDWDCVLASKKNNYWWRDNEVDYGWDIGDLILKHIDDEKK